ncbi:hypothetical protein BDV28DRAFT_154904 [Aspergillus coremiiformis]|uniref:Geranylgeranyl pyrophosphate synthetase n=1 Tax=Aspergillus coremiiformis TaxID=138285 RepID=A0A5N6ZFM1_9EURO|nr:hypothetical protein BDV28DRAFT_154904 [Aspergillus coremiiformis]
MLKERCLKGLGEILAEIPLESIQPRDGLITTKVNITSLTSYNLLPKPRKTIVVPGSPPIWSPPKTPRKLKPDEGRYPIDANRFVFRHCPLEPVFRALSLTRPRMRLTDIDLVTDRRNLRLLLAFVAGKKNVFRIDAEQVHNTTLFTSWTPRAVCYFRGEDGYGHEFERAATRPPRGFRDSIAHHRVIRYRFGDVNLILRHEVDACTGSAEEIRRVMPTSETRVTPTGYTVLKGGAFVAPSRVVEIKTRPAGKLVRVSRATEQLWFSQTPVLGIGVYDGTGTFTKIVERDVSRTGVLKTWEENHQVQLKMLAALLRAVVELGRTSGWKRYALVASDETVKIFNLADQVGQGLPVDLRYLWE